MGNSMGGIIAISMAARHPERVSHLVTMGTGSFPAPTLFGPAGPSEGIKVLVQGYRDPSAADHAPARGRDDLRSGLRDRGHGGQARRGRGPAR